MYKGECLENGTYTEFPNNVTGCMGIQQPPGVQMM